MDLIKDILPHIAALNLLNINTSDNLPDSKLLYNSSKLPEVERCNRRKIAEDKNSSINVIVDGGVSSEVPTTSNHYCVVESEHPYRSGSISCYRVEFPSCVQWFTIEFDPDCGTAQPEDYLTISIPMRPIVDVDPCEANEDYFDILDNNIKTKRGLCKNATLLTSCYRPPINTNPNDYHRSSLDSDWLLIKKFNT